MARISRKGMALHLGRVNFAQTSHEKGRALEDLVCYLFERVPGIEIAQRNALNAFATEELDVALWNAQHANGLSFLPNLLLVECKNWSAPCGSQEVAYFVARLKQRGCEYGILLSAGGITGVPEELTAAHFQVATALAAGIRVIVLTPDECGDLTDTSELVTLIKKKLCQLVVSGTNFLATA